MKSMPMVPSHWTGKSDVNKWKLCGMA